MFILAIILWVWINSLFEPAPRGHERNCSFFFSPATDVTTLLTGDHQRWPAHRGHGPPCPISARLTLALIQHREVLLSPRECITVPTMNVSGVTSWMILQPYIGLFRPLLLHSSPSSLQLPSLFSCKPLCGISSVFFIRFRQRYKLLPTSVAIMRTLERDRSSKKDGENTRWVQPCCALGARERERKCVCVCALRDTLIDEQSGCV